MNPWETIDLHAYESHMSLAGVYQLQALNAVMKEQFCSFPAKSVMVLGIAGGNGLEHIGGQAFQKVYGVDVNETYLLRCRQRFAALDGVLETIRCDLTKDARKLPHAELLIADLLIEYIGCPCFQQVVGYVRPAYLSTVIQINTDDTFVSDSPYIHVFDCLEAVHHRLDEAELTGAMESIGFEKALRAETPLPNGKKLLRMDFARRGECC